MNCTVIIAAGGVGARFSNNVPKQFAELGGVPMIIRTISQFQAVEEVTSIVVACHIDWFTKLNELIKEHNLSKVAKVVVGGKTRQDSVATALKTDEVKESEIVLVHDAARPFVSTKLIKAVIEETEELGAVVPGLAPSDTIKEHKSFAVSKTLDRTTLSSIQTPQGFWTDLFINANERANQLKMQATDDASLAEFSGTKVQIIDGEETNIKITSPLDMHIAEMMIEKKLV